MRLIDADALKDRLQNLASDDWNQNTPTVWAEAFSEVVDMVEDAPTIEPRKKGKWIEHNPHKWGLGIVFECSECGEKIECEPSNYCPNCGAEMTEESEEPKRCDSCKHEKTQWFNKCADCSDYELWEKKE